MRYTLKHLFLSVATAAAFAAFTSAAQANPTFTVFADPTDVIGGQTVGSIGLTTVNDSGLIGFSAGAPSRVFAGPLGSIQLVADATTFALPDKPAGASTSCVDSSTPTDGSN